MVFGNKGESSCTGVCFTRDPSTGRGALYGEFLVNAQGEDVVAGIRTPEPIGRMRERMPDAYAELTATRSTGSRSTTATCRTSSSRSRRARCTCSRRERASGPRQAALRIAVEMVGEG